MCLFKIHNSFKKKEKKYRHYDENRNNNKVKLFEPLFWIVNKNTNCSKFKKNNFIKMKKEER
mgnify:CR=1 FL=1